MRWMIVPYGESQSGALFKKVRQKVASFSKRCVKSDAPFPNGKFFDKKGVPQSGALFKKVRQKVASFFKKGDESDTPVDRGFSVGAA